MQTICESVWGIEIVLLTWTTRVACIQTYLTRGEIITTLFMILKNLSFVLNYTYICEECSKETWIFSGGDCLASISLIAFVKIWNCTKIRGLFCSNESTFVHFSVILFSLTWNCASNFLINFSTRKNCSIKKKCRLIN